MVTPPTAGKAASGDFPYWLVAAVLIGAYLLWQIAADEVYSEVIVILSRGVVTTLRVTAIAFFFATLFGLILAMMALSNALLLRQVSRFYVEIMRGIPILVLLFYIAFVGAPALASFANWLTTPLQAWGWMSEIRTRDISLEARAILALTLAYAAFISEVFRAGLQAVDTGQIDAGKALGLSGRLRFRLIVFPQAFRTILPPLGNDLIAMIKDSSLVSVLGVTDITQLGKIYSSGSFRFFETYNVVAYLYLVMTVSLAIALRGFEDRMRRRGRDG